MSNLTIEPLNLDRFEEPFFQNAIRRHVEAYVAHFGARLVAVYVSGSVHRDEAVLGISDLDLFSFIRDPLRPEDGAWREQTRADLERELGPLHGLTLPRTLTDEFVRALPDPPPMGLRIIADAVDGTLRCQDDEPGADAEATETMPAWVRGRVLRARDARPWGLRLRYDATRVYGPEVIAPSLIPPPDLSWARIAFLGPWEIVRYAAGTTRENQTDFVLPGAPALRLRYLAKLAVYGGASLLMARGQFASYRGPDVFDPLSRSEPAWAPFLSETRGLYIHPVADAAARLPSYLAGVTAWMEWVAGELDLGRRRP
jgi:hypothetical protein